MTNDISSDMTALADAANSLGISVRHAQRLLHRVADDDKGVGDNGGTVVRLSALSALVRHRNSVTDQVDSPRRDVRALTEQVATLTASLSQAQAEVERLQSTVEKLELEKSRLYDIVSQTQQDASEWRRMLVASNPRLLPADASLDASVRPAETFWTRLWRRG